MTVSGHRPRLLVDSFPILYDKSKLTHDPQNSKDLVMSPSIEQMLSVLHYCYTIRKTERVLVLPHYPVAAFEASQLMHAA
jgi:hypothetical protein